MYTEQTKPTAPLCNIVQRTLDPSDARQTGFADWHTGPTRDVLYCKTHGEYLDNWPAVREHKEKVAYDHQNQTN